MIKTRRKLFSMLQDSGIPEEYHKQIAEINENIISEDYDKEKIINDLVNEVTHDKKIFMNHFRRESKKSKVVCFPRMDYEANEIGYSEDSMFGQSVTMLIAFYVKYGREKAEEFMEEFESKRNKD